MARDIGLKLDGDGIHFNIVNQKDTDIPNIIQTAITLLFFSNQEAFRSVFGGIYNIVGQCTESAIDDLNMELADVSFTLNRSLQQIYPEIVSTKFDIDINHSYVHIILTINTNTDSISAMIYNSEV